ncbi:7-cyano-7-deazaguanine synthase [Geomonas paludis]|uniref:7-cyano-7-deazaguanine synthase n=1 Tax=Geomonas paludis TaxID=2740185 RepID=A0A6V8MTU9_9BACT|nr:7-cyano-7-deazaguanine synthase [Geomonas paludis]GFO63157.1 hypothetical protein GMPD_10760 [Geomonas paludis]
MNPDKKHDELPQLQVQVLEEGCPAMDGWESLYLGKDIIFSTWALQSYAFARWDPLIFDVIVLAAGIEYADKVLRRPSLGWARRIRLKIPVHSLDVWSSSTVATALQNAVEFLTGDYWTFEFVQRVLPAKPPSQDSLQFPANTVAVLPYSDGMDSRSVAGILGKAYKNQLVRVRVGSKSWDRKISAKNCEPFTTVPYKVPVRARNRETSGRSRGFKYTIISCIAAYLAGATEIVIPESGQGALGPAIMNVGHGYPDYRNHPFFTKKMEHLYKQLFGSELHFIFPRIWSTKGETLKEFVEVCNGADWKSTRSCWQSNIWAGVNGKLRQCGICAACMLRRVSVHAAGLVEDPDVYIVTDLTAKSMESAVHKGYSKVTKAFKEYAIAGTLHMDDLARMADAAASPIVKRHATLLASVMDLPCQEAEQRLGALLNRHAKEWRNYLESLGEDSFVKQWVRVEI